MCTVITEVTSLHAPRGSLGVLGVQCQHACVPYVCTRTLALLIPLHVSRCVQTLPPCRGAGRPSSLRWQRRGAFPRARERVCSVRPGFTMLTPANLLIHPVALPSCAPRASWGPGPSAMGRWTQRVSRGVCACAPINSVGARVCVRGLCHFFCGASLAPPLCATARP